MADAPNSTNSQSQQSTDKKSTQPDQSGQTSKSKGQPNGKRPKQREIKVLSVKINLNQLMNKGLLYLFIGLLFLPFIISLVQSNSAEKITLSQMVADVREEKV